MQPDNGAHFIVDHSFGDFEVRPCTLEEARSLLTLHLSSLPQEVKALVDAKQEADGYFITASLLDHALHEACTGAPDAPRLRTVLYGPVRRGEEDTRPQALVSPELRTECIMWKVENGLNPLNRDNLSAQVLTEKWLPAGGTVQKALLARIAPRQAHIVDDWVLDMYIEYKQLMTGKWKDSARECDVVARYLTFITENLTHRDVRYAVAALRKTEETCA